MNRALIIIAILVAPALGVIGGYVVRGERAEVAPVTVAKADDGLAQAEILMIEMSQGRGTVEVFETEAEGVYVAVAENFCWYVRPALHRTWTHDGEFYDTAAIGPPVECDPESLRAKTGERS